MPSPSQLATFLEHLKTTYFFDGRLSAVTQELETRNATLEWTSALTVGDSLVGITERVDDLVRSRWRLVRCEVYLKALACPAPPFDHDKLQELRDVMGVRKRPRV